ncbi:MAG: glycoside hydrolase family 16 protein [Prevotella sp.]|nr:glycoside hydrolase family 16 protein [Prevotella sp.]
MNGKLFNVLVLSLFTAISMKAQNYKLVWSDDFNANTLGKNWNVETVASPYNHELEYYTPRQENVTVKDGNLILTARREHYGDKAFTSGRVNSRQKVYFAHGMIEARIKLPRLSNGLWPAFWMMGEDDDVHSWPACGEIDIIEMGEHGGISSGQSDRWVGGTIHWGEDAQHHQQWSDQGQHAYDYTLAGDDQYHIYTMTWDDTYIRMYIDHSNKPYFTAAINKRIDSRITSDIYMHKPFYILFDLAVGGDFTGILSPEGITALADEGSEAKMYIDYVRVYQEKGQENLVCPDRH